LGHVVRHGGDRRRLLDVRLGDRLRQKAVCSRAEEGLRAAEQHLDDDELPDRHRVGEDQHREQPVKREADEVGDDHQAVPRQPICPHPSEQQEGHERQALRREHESEIGGAPGSRDHEQRECDQHDVVPDDARGLRDPQVAEVAVAEHPPYLAETPHRPASLTQSRPRGGAQALRGRALAPRPDPAAQIARLVPAC
jgi:hypothetical protein